MNTEEAFAVLCDINRKGGIVGHDSPHDNDVRPCPACENIRALALTVHIEACGIRFDDIGNEFKVCGDDWYCSVAQQYLPQK